MYRIEKNVPLPPKKRRQKYPFGEMKVGESFGFPLGDRQRVGFAACIYGKRNNKKFSIRKLKDGTYRVWRIE